MADRGYEQRAGGDADHGAGHPEQGPADLLPGVVGAHEGDEGGDHGPVEAAPGQQITKGDGRADGRAHLDRGTRVAAQPDPVAWPGAGLERRVVADLRRAGQPAAKELDRRLERAPAFAGRAGGHPLGDGVGQGDDGTGKAVHDHHRGPVLAVRNRPGLTEQADQPGGMSPRVLVLTPDQVAQRQAGLEVLGGREPDAGHGQGETGDVGQGQLGVEQALVKQLSGRAVGHSARIAELGVDHQGGLIQPHQLPVQAADVPRRTAGAVEYLECQGGHLAGPGRERALSALQGLGLARVEKHEPDGGGDGEADTDLGGEPAQGPSVIAPWRKKPRKSPMNSSIPDMKPRGPNRRR